MDYLDNDFFVDNEGDILKVDYEKEVDSLEYLEELAKIKANKK